MLFIHTALMHQEPGCSLLGDPCLLGYGEIMLGCGNDSHCNLAKLIIFCSIFLQKGRQQDLAVGFLMYVGSGDSTSSLNI